MSALSLGGLGWWNSAWDPPELSIVRWVSMDRAGGNSPSYLGQPKKENCQSEYWRWPMIDEKSSVQMAVESAGTSLIKQQMLQSFQTAKEYRHGFVEEAIDRKSTCLNSSHLVISYA